MCLAWLSQPSRLPTSRCGTGARRRWGRLNPQRLAARHRTGCQGGAAGWARRVSLELVLNDARIPSVSVLTCGGQGLPPFAGSEAHSAPAGKAGTRLEQSEGELAVLCWRNDSETANGRAAACNSQKSSDQAATMLLGAQPRLRSMHSFSPAAAAESWVAGGGRSAT